MGDDLLEFLMGEDPDMEQLEKVESYIMTQITRYSIMMHKLLEMKALARGLGDDGSEEDPDARC